MSHKFFNIDWNKSNKINELEKEKLKKISQNDNNTVSNISNSLPNSVSTINKQLTYFLPPPIINSTVRYQDINKDSKLRNLITMFYLKKTIKWINKYDEFNSMKKLLPELENKHGYKIIYTILRKFVKKHNYNWYDLKNYYERVKDYIRHKLNKI